MIEMKKQVSQSVYKKFLLLKLYLISQNMPSFRYHRKGFIFLIKFIYHKVHDMIQFIKNSTIKLNFSLNKHY